MSTFALLVIIKTKNRTTKYPGKQTRNNIMQIDEQILISQHKVGSIQMASLIKICISEIVILRWPLVPSQHGESSPLLLIRGRGR